MELFKIKDLVFKKEEFLDDISEFEDIILILQDMQNELTYDEIAVYKKMVSRISAEFMCKIWLAERFDLSVEFIDKKIEQFKSQGCLLFTE